MTKPDPEVERVVDLLFSAPDPNELFVRRLDQQLQKKLAVRSPEPTRPQVKLLRFWSSLYRVGRWGIGFATTGALIALLALGMSLIPGANHIPPEDAVGTPPHQPSASPTFHLAQMVTPRQVLPALAPSICRSSVSQPVLATDGTLRSGTQLGGSVVKSGPFTFDLRLFCDPKLGPDQPGNQFSEISGLGIHRLWVYEGSQAAGPINEFWGLEPYIDLSTGASAGLGQGTKFGSNSGMYFPRKEYPGRAYPDWANTETELRYVIKVQSSLGAYGARLSFVLKREADGFHILNASTEALPFEANTPTPVPTLPLTIVEPCQEEKCANEQFWFTTAPPKCQSTEGKLIFGDRNPE